MHNSILINRLRDLQMRLLANPDVNSNSVTDAHVLNEVIELLDRVVVIRARHEFPLEYNIPADKMDEMAKGSLCKSFASYIMSDELYGQDCSIIHHPGTRSETYRYDGVLRVIKP